MPAYVLFRTYQETAQTSQVVQFWIKVRKPLTLGCKPGHDFRLCDRPGKQGYGPTNKTFAASTLCAALCVLQIGVRYPLNCSYQQAANAKSLEIVSNVNHVVHCIALESVIPLMQIAMAMHHASIFQHMVAPMQHRLL